MYKSVCNKKFIALMMLLTVLLCSFLGIEYDMTGSKVSLIQSAPESNMSEHRTSASMDELVVHIIDNKNSVLDEYTSETAIARQLSTKRSGVNTFRGLYIVVFILCALSLLFLTSIYLYSGRICCSQRYIIRYIHNKDGQKA